MNKFNGDNVENLPQPAGYRVLVGRMKLEEKTQGGIILPDEITKAKENNLSIMKVLALGNLAYKAKSFKVDDHDDAPTAPWCKVGDVVLVSKYTGLDVLVTDNEGSIETLKIINDDEVISVVSDINALVV